MCAITRARNPIRDAHGAYTATPGWMGRALTTRNVQGPEQQRGSYHESSSHSIFTHDARTAAKPAARHGSLPALVSNKPERTRILPCQVRG
jgi:hypothetical protein